MDDGSKSNLKEIESAKEKALEIALSQIQKRFGEGSAMKLGDAPAIKVETISTGSFSLDLALGVGGLPRGRVVEIYGPEASGKTTLALTTIAEAQKMGGTAAFIDAEHALDIERAKTLGVDIKNLILSQPSSGEEALEILETLIRSNALDVIVVDSVAALTPKAEIEGEMGDAVMGAQARLMSQAMRKITSIASKSKTLIIFTNQIRMKIGVMFGNPETTTGGQALKFYSSVRIEIRKTGNVTKGDEVIGTSVKVKVVKNKVAPPFRVAEFDIIHNKGIQQEKEIVLKGIETGVLKLSGSWVSYGDEKLGQGKDQAAERLEKDKALASEIKEKIVEKVFSNK